MGREGGDQSILGRSHGSQGIQSGGGGGKGGESQSPTEYKGSNIEN